MMMRRNFVVVFVNRVLRLEIALHHEVFMKPIIVVILHFPTSLGT